METVLIAFIFIIGIIVFTSILNEKKLHIQKDVALVLISFSIGVVLLLLKSFCFKNIAFDLESIKEVGIGSTWLKFILPFILFASASNIHISKFKDNIKTIALLSIITTVISALIYGVLFYGINFVVGLNLDIWKCMLLGCLISPTDPIAITATLKKLGASKNLLSVIEGEALFNDGVGMILFVFVSGAIKLGTTGSFVVALFKEIIGAVVLGLVISFLMFKLIKKTNEPLIHILISLLTVAILLFIGEKLGVSGDIAAVIAGIYFAYKNQKISRWKEVVDTKELYNDFWNIASSLLNSIFFVLIGISILYMDINIKTLILIPTAIILNLVSRAIGVGTSTVLIGKNKIPRKYSFKDFILLMTCSGSKGILSLALVMSTKSFLSANEYMILFSATIITLLFTIMVQEIMTKKVYKYIENKKNEKSLIVQGEKI